MSSEISHFTDIGFALDTGNKDLFAHSLERLTRKCELVSLNDRDSLCSIKDSSGAELWVGLARGADGVWEIMTANPAFSGDGRTAINFDDDVSDPENPFEKTIAVHLDDHPNWVAYLDLADPRQMAALKSREKTTLDIAAFSYKPEVFKDETTFLKAQDRSSAGARFGAHYFIPSGHLFEVLGAVGVDEARTVRPYADFAGPVLKSEQRTNALGGGKFWLVTVKPDKDLALDVVIDPASITEIPKPGAIVSGGFWLSARIVP